MQLAKIVGLVLMMACAGLMIVGGPEYLALASILGGLAGVTIAVDRVRAEYVAFDKTKPATPGPPEHIHWPEPVLSLYEEPVGRYICVDCYDEVPGSAWVLGPDGMAPVMSTPDGRAWTRDRAGRVFQPGPPSQASAKANLVRRLRHFSKPAHPDDYEHR